eukprot:139202-Rhodomonas_salina.2
MLSCHVADVSLDGFRRFLFASRTGDPHFPALEAVETDHQRTHGLAHPCREQLPGHGSRHEYLRGTRSLPNPP